MRTFLLAALLAVGCSSAPGPQPDAGRPDAGSLVPDAGELDAGAPDAGPPETVRLDWRTVRGPALEPVVVAEASGEPFALGDSTWAVWGRCDAGVCAASWYDDRGKLVRHHAALVPAATGWISPTGLQFAAVEVARTFECSAGGYTSRLQEGRWALFDAQSGEQRFAAPHVGAEGIIRSTFSSFGSLAWRDPVNPTTCELEASRVLRTLPPWDAPKGLEGIPSDVPTYAEDDFRDGQLVVTARRGLQEQLYLASPEEDGRPLLHDDDMRQFGASGDWLHSSHGYPYTRLFQTHVPTRTRREVPLPADEDDFVRLDVSGPWAMACAFNDGARCELSDARGQHPARTVRSRSVPVMLGDDDFVLTRDADAGIERVDLRTGARAFILEAKAVARVGRTRAAVVWTPRELKGVTRTQTLSFGHAWSLAALPSSAIAQPQSDVVFLVSADESGGAARLEAWNVATGRVALLTDSLFFNPPSGAPFTADTRCMAPGFVRHAGPPAASATQPGRLLHFTEFVPAAQPKVRVFVVPADLSSPPRLVAELDPDVCAPPLVSPSLRRLWLPVRMGEDRVRVVLADL
ncbi:MAG: hypothetical protein ACOZQL_34505 [Myxococcota bacterium]